MKDLFLRGVILALISAGVVLVIAAVRGEAAIEIFIIIFIVLGGFLLALGLVLGAKIQEYDDRAIRINDMESQLSKRRHTYPTADGLEDALAVTIDLLLREEAASKYRQARYDQAIEILGKVREGPLSYDSDRPNSRPTLDDDIYAP